MSDELSARVHALIAQVPMPTHFNHRAFSNRDGHTWQNSDIVIDTAPPIYHRWCETCGMVQQKTDESDWSDDLGDTLRGYRQRILKALEAALAAALVPKSNAIAIDDLDLSGDWNAHMDAVRPAIAKLDRQQAEAKAAARGIAVSNAVDSPPAAALAPQPEKRK